MLQKYSFYIRGQLGWPEWKVACVLTWVTFFQKNVSPMTKSQNLEVARRGFPMLPVPARGVLGCAGAVCTARITETFRSKS